MTTSITQFTHTDRQVADLRAVSLRRRFRASEAVEAVLVELVFGIRDGAPTAIRIAPSMAEGRR